jgi:hypothetical protein
MDTAWAACAALDYARDEIRVASENADYAARNARAERGEAEKPVADRRSRAREITAATQRGIDNRLRLYRERDQVAQESIQGANDNKRQTTTPTQRNAEKSGPASRDMAWLSRQEREGKADGASEISEAVRDDDRYPNARKVAAVTQRGVENSPRLRRERAQAAQESIRRANDTLRQSTTPLQAEATTNRAEERARLGRARDQAERNQTFEQRLLRKSTPEGRAYDRFIQEPNSYATSQSEAAARFQRHVARKPVQGERSNKKFKTMAKCPLCNKLTSSRDKKALQRDIDNNSDSVRIKCQICYREREKKMLYRCCRYVNSSCLGCALRCKFAEPDRHYESWEM